MKKIAIPVRDELLDSHFGHCEHFQIFDIENDTIVNETRSAAPPHAPNVIPNWIAEQGVSDIIVGRMGNRARDILLKKDINVIAGAPCKPPKEIISSYIKGELILEEKKCSH